MQPKKHKNTPGPTGLYELFLLTVPIEEAARWQYKTVLIIFPLNLQTITIALDAVSTVEAYNVIPRGDPVKTVTVNP